MMEGLFGGGSSQSKGPSDAQFGRHNAGAGRTGEDFYDRGFGNAGIKANYSTYRSLDIPAQPGTRPMSGDVDTVAASKQAAVLIDVKKWTGGHIYWSLNGKGFKGFLQPALREEDGTPKWSLSRNMEIAQERYRAALPKQIAVYAMVVFVPADVRRMEASVPRSVRQLIWPGGIRSYLADESYDVLERLLGAPSKAHGDVDRILRHLERA
jgi:hypothetical protein